jgi:SAM-dependent methyltransferase
MSLRRKKVAAKNIKTQDIFNYWEGNAQKFGKSHEASWGDINMMTLERDTIAGYIKSGDKVLDAGCANGFTTLHYLSRKPSLIKAFDYSPTMVKQANTRAKRAPTKIPLNIYQANILAIPEKDGVFDVAITTRVLINLPTRRLQKKAIEEMFRVTKSGGLVLFSEAFLGGFKRINKARALFDLPPLQMPAFNNYLDESWLGSYLSSKKYKFEFVPFSSLYYLGSRLIREIYMDQGEQASFKHPINDFFYNLEKQKDKFDFGVQKLCVIKKTK